MWNSNSMCSGWSEKGGMKRKRRVVAFSGVSESEERVGRNRVLAFLSGGIAGSVAKSAIAPLDRVKIIFMTSSSKFSFQAAGAQLRAIWNREGLRGLWRGNFATVTRVYPYAGIQYVTFGMMTKTLTKYRPGGRLRARDRLFAGACAGAMSALVTLPLDTARARLAVYHPGHVHGRNGLNEVLTDMWRGGGMRGLYRALTPTLLGIIPYSGLSFATFETLKQRVRDKTGSEPTTLQRLAFGATAGLVGQTASFPIDVCRRRMQTFVPTSEHPIPPTMIQVFRNVVQTSGWRGLFRALPLNYAKGPLAVAISFTTFDFLRKTLHF